MRSIIKLCDSLAKLMDSILFQKNSSAIRFSGFFFATNLLLTHVRKINGESRIEGNDFINITINFLNERNVFNQIVVNFGPMVVVHLLNQNSVPIQNRLHLLEAVSESGPHPGAAAVEGFVAGAFVLFHIGVVDEIGRGGGVAVISCESMSSG